MVSLLYTLTARPNPARTGGSGGDRHVSARQSAGHDRANTTGAFQAPRPRGKAVADTATVHVSTELRVCVVYFINGSIVTLTLGNLNNILQSKHLPTLYLLLPSLLLPSRLLDKCATKRCT